MYSSVNKRADNGTTPVYFAAQEGRLDCLQFLVTQVNALTGNLHLFYIAYAIDSIDHLHSNSLQVDGNCRLRASDGMAPVHAAAQMGQLECLAWLVCRKINDQLF